MVIIIMIIIIIIIIIKWNTVKKGKIEITN